MKFREHRGGYEESMQTVREIRDLQELIYTIEEIFESKVEAIGFKYYGVDQRNGRETYLVLADFKDISPACPVGWTDSHFGLGTIK